jgi:hypothetical protein
MHPNRSRDCCVSSRSKQQPDGNQDFNWGDQVSESAHKTDQKGGLERVDDRFYKIVLVDTKESWMALVDPTPKIDSYHGELI